MPRIVRCGLIQARNAKGPEAGLPAIKKAMLEKHLKLIDKAGEKLATMKETPGLIKYVGSQVIELLDGIDPKKAKELGDKLMSSEALKQMGQAPGGAGAGKVSAELQKRIQELMDKQKNQPAPMPGPVAPAPEAPAPGDAAPTDAPAPAPSGAP